MRYGPWEDPLVQFNIRGFLKQALSIEEHLAQTSLEERMNSWCAEKHSILAEGGHLDELVVLMAAKDPKRNESLMALREKWRALEDNKAKGPDEYRELRNEFRQIMGLLSDDDCKVCKDDRPKVALLDARLKQVTEEARMSLHEAETPTAAPPPKPRRKLLRLPRPWRLFTRGRRSAHPDTLAETSS